MKLRHLMLAVGATIITASPVLAQAAPGGPQPGTGDGAAIAGNNRDEASSYNRVIGRVGSDPVGMEKAKRAAKARAVPATAADVVPGAAVRDVNGAALGTIEKIDGDSAILVYSTGRIRYPLIGFGKDAQGLVIDRSTKDFLALVAAAKAGS